MELIVVHPRRLPVAPAGRWAYADGNPLLHDRILCAWGAESRLLPPMEFQRRASRLQSPFAQWVDKNLRGTPPQQWLMTPLDKNPFATDLFLHLTWLTILDEALRAEAGPLTVVTESLGLARTLQRLCGARRIPCCRIGRFDFLVSQAKLDLRATADLVFNTLRLAYRLALSRLILGKAQLLRLRGVELLVETYLRESNLAQDGRFDDSYLPGLVAWYEKQGFRAASYPFLYRIPWNKLPAVYSRMKRSPVLFAPFELFIEPEDVLSAIRSCLARALTRKELTLESFADLEVLPLVRLLSLRTAFDGLTALVLLRAPKRMRAAAIRPRWFIDWYENQPIDKANALGFGAIDSGCRAIALRQYVPSSNFRSLYTTPAEVEAGVAPSENWVCGRAVRELLSCQDGKGEYRIVPALRYMHLHRPLRDARQERFLVVLLTHSLEESLSILSRLVPVLPEARALFEAIKIKSHPALETEKIRSASQALWPSLKDPSNVFWEQLPVDRALESAKIVMTAGSSGALEAVCRGVPVILIGRSAGLDINPLEAVDRRLWTLIYDASQLSDALHLWMPRHPLSLAERAALGSAIRETYFEPVTETSMQEFIPDTALSGVIP